MERKLVRDNTFKGFGREGVTLADLKADGTQPDFTEVLMKEGRDI